MKTFTRKYSLSKTLRFELRPVGETKNNISKFIEQDKERAQDYKAMKELLDAYYRYFIEEVLSERNLLNPADLETAYLEYKNQFIARSDKNLKALQDKLRKQITTGFEARKKDYHLDEYSKLINLDRKNRQESYLSGWLKEQAEKGKLDREGFEEKKKILLKFNKFVTYFSGYKENRENMFTNKEQSTAIAFRIVNVNLVKYFNNCLNFEKIKEKYTNLADILNINSDVFDPVSFNSYITQTGIDNYNQKIGRKADDINGKGVNQIINEYRQKNGIKNRDLRMMVQLYKQVLSDKEKVFRVDKFDNDEQMMTAVAGFYDEIKGKNVAGELKECFAEYFKDNGVEDIYITKKSLNSVSQTLWGDWSVLDQAITEYINLQGGTKKEQNIKLNQKAFSLNFLSKALDDFKSDSEEKEKLRGDILINHFKQFKNKDMRDL
ncbi:MAG: hypothetical protein ABH869_03455 [Candidatus Omnitrophota bacterium]